MSARKRKQRQNRFLLASYHRWYRLWQLTPNPGTNSCGLYQDAGK